MPLGQSYASGYGLGQRDREIDFNQSQTALSGLKTGRPMSDLIELKREKTASEMLEESKQLALKTKAMELDNKERELKMQEIVLNNATERAVREKESEANIGLKGAQTGAMEYETGRKERDEYRGLVTADEKQKEQNLLNNAMRGFYTGDVQAVKDYFDYYGQPGVSIQDIRKSSNGQIIVDFGEGREARFNSPREAIEQLLVPAQLIQKGIAGKMTEAQQATSQQNQKKIDISERGMTAEEALNDAKIKVEEAKASGNLTPTAVAEIKSEIYIKLTNAKNGIPPTNEEFAKAISTIGLSNSPGLNSGLNTGDSSKTNGYQTKDDVKAAFQSGEITKDEALKILRNKFGMN